eukprot:2707955-Alexandrium_andersonii.AAC.1
MGGRPTGGQSAAKHSTASSKHSSSRARSAVEGPGAPAQDGRRAAASTAGPSRRQVLPLTRLQDGLQERLAQ